MDLADELDQLCIREVLDQDSRPLFVIDLDPDDEESPNAGNIVKPVFVNSALRLHQRLLDVVTGAEVADESLASGASLYKDFRSWVIGVTKHDDSKDIFPLFFEFGNLLWTGSTVRRRWRLISGNMLWKQNAPSRDISSGPIEVAAGPASVVPRKADGSQIASQKASLIAPDGTTNSYTRETLGSSKQAERLVFSKTSVDSSSGNSSGNKSGISLSGPEKACPDWTADQPKGTLTPHMEFARSIDWSLTGLGSMSSWSPELRQIANLAMGDPHPVSV
jgi:hypothetical protein